MNFDIKGISILIGIFFFFFFFFFFISETFEKSGQNIFKELKLFEPRHEKTGFSLCEYKGAG